MCDEASTELRFPRRRCGSFAAALAICAWFAGSVSAATFRIEIDYMVDDDHSHQPSQAVINAVVQMFACQGHTLIIEVDDAIPHSNVLVRNPDDCDSSLFNYVGGIDSFGLLKLLYFDHSHADGWHYCIFAHQYEDGNCNVTGSSGLGQLSGWNFIVSLGGFDGQVGTLFDQASTLAHEFGHNLGLTHCGQMLCNDDTGSPFWVGPHVPNLPSTMSYRYQLAGVRANMQFLNLAPEQALFKNIDFSHGRMCSLNENALDENFGTGMRSTDWNCNGTLQSNVAQDINGNNSGWCGSNGNRWVLIDYNEWANISDPSGIAGEYEEISCITAEEWAEVQAELALGGSSQPALTTEPCQGGLNVYVGAQGTIPFGTCQSPIGSVKTAHDASPNNSVFFIMPGTYDEPNVLTLNKPGIYMCNVGTATVH